MIFAKRQNYLAQKTGVTLGSTQTFDIPRDFHIDNMFLKVRYTSSASIATATTDGFLGLVKNIQLVINDGARTRTVVNSSGRGLIELGMHLTGNLDRNTWACKDVTATSTSAFSQFIPIYFCPPNLSDPVSQAFLLPAPRLQTNPQLVVTMASQADLDSNATPTAAASAITLDLIVNRREVTVPGFRTIDTDLVENTLSWPGTASNQIYQLPVPGSYLGLLMRNYTDVTSATGRGVMYSAGGFGSLQVVGTVMRRWQNDLIEVENDLSENSPVIGGGTGAGTPFIGSYYLDFISDRVGQDASELGSVLDTNFLAGIGAKLDLYQDITGGANVQQKLLLWKAYGDLSGLKARFRAGAKK
jgi:hypothetical protein